jgi:ABC-type sulfate transport system permease component
VNCDSLPRAAEAASLRASGAARRGAALDFFFLAGLGTLLTSYVALIVALLLALAMFTSGNSLLAAVQSEDIRFAMKLSLLSCTLTTLLSLCIAVPAGYVLSRARFTGLAFRHCRRLVRLLRKQEGAGTAETTAVEVRARKPRTLQRLARAIVSTCWRDFVTRSRQPAKVAGARGSSWQNLRNVVGRPGRPRLLEILATIGNILRGIVDALLDIPIVLPPLVIGLALLILFNSTRMGRAVEEFVPVTFAVPSVVLAQFSVACAFAVRTMRVTFDQISPRTERVAWTLGCSRWQAFWMITMPEARRGVLTAATLAWARSLGEFGPILVFSGATRMRTEVLPTTIFLELSTGNIEAAAAVSLMMVLTALIILVLARWFGLRGSGML